MIVDLQGRRSICCAGTTVKECMQKATLKHELFFCFIEGAVVCDIIHDIEAMGY